MSSHRKTQGTYRNGNDRNVRSENTLSTFTTWTKYDEKTERFTKYSSYSDTDSEAEAKESSFSKDLRKLGSAIKASVNVDSSGRSSEEKVYERDIPERYRSSVYERRSRSPFRETPPRHYDRGTVPSNSRSRYGRSRNRYRRSCSHERGDNISKRSKRSKRSKHRRRSTGRYHERGRKRAKRSPSVRKRSLADQYHYDRGDKARKRLGSRRRSRSRSDSYRRSYSIEKGDKLKKYRCRSRSNTSSSESSDESTKRSKSPNKSRAHDDRSGKSLNNSNPQSDANKWQDGWTIDVGSSSESSAETDLRSTNSNQKLDNNYDSVLDPNRKKIQFTLTKPLKIESNDSCTTTTSLTDARSKLSALITSALNDRKNSGGITANDSHATTTSLTDVKSRLSALITSTLNDRKNTGGVTSNDLSKPSQNIEYDFLQQNEPRAFENQGTEESVQCNIASRASSKEHPKKAETPIESKESSSIDDKIIKQIQSFRIQPEQQSQSYCPLSGSKCTHVHCNPSKVSPVRETSNKNLLPPIFTPTLTPTPMKTHVQLPISSLKSVPKTTFQTSSLPHRENPSNPNHFKPSLNGNVNRQNSCKNASDHRPTVSNKSHSAYGEHKRLQASKALVWNFRIPKKITPINRSTSAVVDDSESRNSQPTSRSDENGNNYFPNQSTENKNISSAGSNPSTEENTLKMLKELMSTAQFATLVNLMGKMTQQTTLTKIQEALGKGDTKEEGRDVLSTTSSGGNNITATVASHESITTRKQNTETTIHPKTSIDSLTTKNSKIPHQRMEKSSVNEKPTFQNISLEWHSLKKVVSCQVCNKPHGASLVSHYVNDHPNSEVLVSRLAPEAAECLRSQEGIDKCKITRPPGSKVYQYHQFCFFCNVHKSFGKNAWIIHMARHTGYYRFKCNDCSRLFADKPQHIRCAQKNNFEKIPQPQLHRKDVKAYVCDLCNYVRFHKKEIEMHLTNEHEDDSKKFTEHTFLSFPDKKSKSKSKSKFLDDFIVHSESDYESDSEIEYESDWVSEDEGADENDENDETDLETCEMDLETYDIESDETEFVVPELMNEPENTE